MNITEKTYNNLQLLYEQKHIIATDDIDRVDFRNEDANVSLQDWSGHENLFDPFKNSTGSEKYNREVEIDVTWAKIAKLSREEWSKENPLILDCN